jgi:hypothetical protein
MRRSVSPLFLSLLGIAGALSAQLPPPPAPSLLGAAGEVYRVQRGAYRDLFPGAASTNPVLALEVARDGQPLRRTLIPGSDGPEPEQAVALAADGDHVYVLWGDGHRMIASGFRGDGWDDAYPLDLDAASQKMNPQVVTTRDRFDAPTGGAGESVSVQRTVLHLVWLDRGVAGDRVLYTALVSEGGVLQRANRVVDLQQLAAGNAGVAPTAAAPQMLRQRPQLRPGRDGKSALVGLVDRDGGELVTLELRPVGGDITAYADFARAVVIETGRQYT